MDISAANSVGDVGCLFVHIWRQKDEMYSVCLFRFAGYLFRNALLRELLYCGKDRC